MGDIMNILVFGGSNLAVPLISEFSRSGHNAVLFPNYIDCLLGKFSLNNGTPSDIILTDGQWRLYDQMQARRGRFYNYYPNTRDEAYLALQIIDSFMSQFSPRLVVFQNIPHEGFDYLAYLYCKYNNIQTVLLYQSIFENRFFINNGLDSLWQNSKVRSTRLSLTDVANAELPYMSNIETSYAFLYKLNARLERFFSARWLNNFNTAFVHRAAKLMETPLDISYAINHARYFQLDLENILKKDIPYIYFPLHLQPELTTATLGGQYDDQLLALESLSRKLPSEFKILVKENPKQASRYRSDLFFKRLLSIPKVGLVKKGTKSSELIRYAHSVCTVTGTAGWEALMAGKPVSYFGNPWYSCLTGAIQFDAVTTEFFKTKQRVCYQKLNYEFGLLSQTMPVGIVDPFYAKKLRGFSYENNAHNVANSIIDFVS